ncbi:MAG: alcohol dehydrogenase catalytic domain-containing protein [Candidatus Rokubacteria bacterium]|nr:alcohol dehydrogenase catalytic domain-containing protein [Candidatus Rokubacteria bacterium]
MKASVSVGDGALELRDWPVPAAGPGELLLRMRGCGLCGSDIAKLMSGRAAPPAVLGHEVVGDVLETGAGVSRFAPGDRVVVAHHVPCFQCHYCRRGSPSMCRVFKRINLDPGGFAERVRVPAPNVEHAAFAIPTDVPDETASFTEPLACCLRAVKRCGTEAGDTVVVVGLGSIGCLLVQGFRLAGATVVATDLLAERRRLGLLAGAQVFERDADLGEALRALTDGRLADAVVITAGGSGLLPWARARVRDGGTVHYFAGGGGDTLPLALEDLYHHELTLSATYSSSPAELREAFDLLVRGAVTVDGLITHRLPLARLAEGVDLMKRQQAVKVYVIP